MYLHFPDRIDSKIEKNISELIHTRFNEEGPWPNAAEAYEDLMSKLETSEEEKNKWRERISKEVKLAVKVQENFLPKRNLKNYPVQGINIAAREVSGDFFSFYPHNDNDYFIIADVAGKGIHAGMVMAKASTLFEIMARDLSLIHI